MTRGHDSTVARRRVVRHHPRTGGAPGGDDTLAGKDAGLAVRVLRGGVARELERHACILIAPIEAVDSGNAGTPRTPPEVAPTGGRRGSGTPHRGRRAGRVREDGPAVGLGGRVRDAS